MVTVRSSLRMFCGTPGGEVPKTAQGEGGEQGDPLMPLLHSFGQHRALEATDREMGANQHLMAFLDDGQVLSSKLQKKTHPKTLSSKNTFIQNHFIQKRRQFHPRHFIPKRVHPMTLSSKNGFVPNHFHPTLNTKTPKHLNTQTPEHLNT